MDSHYDLSRLEHARAALFYHSNNANLLLGHPMMRFHELTIHLCDPHFHKWIVRSSSLTIRPPYQKVVCHIGSKGNPWLHLVLKSDCHVLTLFYVILYPCSISFILFYWFFLMCSYGKLLPHV